MFVDKQHHGSPHWSSHGRLHQDRTANGSTSCHGIPRACGTAQGSWCFGPVWQTGTFLGLIHHKSTWWLHDSDRHRDFAGRTARPEPGTQQTVETAWRDSPGPMILHRWNHQDTSCTVEWWDDSSTAVPIEETLLSRSISCAVVYNPRQ